MKHPRKMGAARENGELENVRVVAISPGWVQNAYQLVYDGQGYWLCQKRLSSGRFRWWPGGVQGGEATRKLAAHQLQVLLSAGNPAGTQAAPDWRPVTPKG